MGITASKSKVSATLRVPGAAQRVSELCLSYRRTTWCGPKERTIAAFTFPCGGWHTLPGGMLVNSSVEAASLRLDKLSRKDARQPVRVTGLTRGASVLRASLLLGDLLAALNRGPQGGWVSSLDFVLERIHCRDEVQMDDGLPPAGPAELQSSSPGLRYALYCNGRLCGETEAAQRGSQRSVMLPEKDRTRLDVKRSQDTGYNTPTVGVPRNKSLGTSRTFQARVIVHRVDDIHQFGELFPDIYVKARMKEPRSEWYRTDVHKKCVNCTALFEYRLVMPLFVYPARPVKAGPCRRLRRFPPMLQIIMMDEDQQTRDDKLGGVTLNLEDLVLPDDRESCSMATLGNKRVSLFDPAALLRVRPKDAVFPRELMGYWPLLKKKKMNRELKTVGSIRLTVQLLTAREAAKFPAAPGNREWPANRYPKLTKPRREHGRIQDKLILGVVQNVEQVIAHATGIPSLRLFIAVVAAVALLVLTVKPAHLTALVVAVYRNGRHYFVQHPNKTKFLIFFYAVSCVAWIFMQRGFGSTKTQKLNTSSE